VVAAVESKSKKSKQVPEELIYDSPNEDVEVEEEKDDSKKGAAKAGDGIKKKSTFHRLTDIITKSPILEPLRSKQ
jgi:hypothetical protein